MQSQRIVCFDGEYFGVADESRHGNDISQNFVSIGIFCPVFVSDCVFQHLEKKSASSDTRIKCHAAGRISVFSDNIAYRTS